MKLLSDLLEKALQEIKKMLPGNFYRGIIIDLFIGDKSSAKNFAIDERQAT